ncbi:protein SMG9-like, partial [Trifolium medium]|nr:protein SMG9-like [Trifolium medium]
LVTGAPITGKFGRGGSGEEDSTQLRSCLPSVASLNLLSDSWDFHFDCFLPFLAENIDFTVIGVTGSPGVEKCKSLTAYFYNMDLCSHSLDVKFPT